MNYINKLFGSQACGPYDADRLGRIKVLIVGNSGSGKSCLAHLLSTGQPVAHTRSTVGCNVTLMVMQYPSDRSKSNPALAGQEFFLELWDIGAHPRYEPMRGLFYQGVNGVILMHDLSYSRSLASLQRWAAEVCAAGSFAAPYGDDRAALNLGGLPVPCLVVGNKLDCLPKYRGRYVQTWGEQLWATLQRPLARLRDCLALALARRRGAPGGDAGTSRQASRSLSVGRSGSGGLGLPKEALLHGNLQASVARGDLDMHAVTSFFCELIERRYCPSLAADLAQLAPAGAGAAQAPLLPPLRLSAERLPPVMYNAISEESSPYSSMRPSLASTPFASTATLLRQGSAVLGGGVAGGGLLRQGSGTWPPAERPPLSTGRPGSGPPSHSSAGGGVPIGHSGAAGPLQFPGVSAAVRLGGGAGRSRLGQEGGKPPSGLFWGGGSSTASQLSQASSILENLQQQQQQELQQQQQGPVLACEPIDQAC